MIQTIATFSFSSLYCPIKIESKTEINDLIKKGFIEYDLLTEANHSHFWHSWEFEQGHVTRDHLCVYERVNNRRPICTVTIRTYGHTKTGTETYWSEQAEAMKTKNVYNNGTLLAQGSLDIEQESIPDSYTDKSGYIKINYFDIQKVFVKELTQTIFSNYQAQTPEIKIDYLKIQAVDEKKKLDSKSSVLEIFMIDETKLENYKEYTAVKKKCPEYTPKDYIKDMLECNFVIPQIGCKFKDAFKLNKYTPAWNFFYHFDYQYTYTDIFNNKEFSNRLAEKEKASSKFTIWTKKKIGNYEYDYAQINNLYKSQCYEGKQIIDKDKIPHNYEIYIYYTKPYIFVINPFSINDDIKENKGLHQLYDKAIQTEYFNKLLNGIEFLK